jgi:hypothetical protein
MDNTYPPGGDAHDRQPTEQFWPMSPGQAGHQDPGGSGHGYQPHEPPGIDQHYAQDRRKAMRWTIGITVAAIMAGGIIAGVAWAGGAGPTAAGPTGQAAALNATLSSADAPAALSTTPSPSGTATSPAGSARPCARAGAAAKAARAAGHPRAARAALAAAGYCHGGRLGVARLVGGIDGQFTFKTKSGFRTLAYERGTIEAVTSGSNIVVRAADGTTWTWDLVSSTVVREKHAKEATSALAAGQPVWVGGQVSSGAKDARLIVIRPPAGSPTPAPSGTGS